MQAKDFASSEIRTYIIVLRLLLRLVCDEVFGCVIENLLFYQSLINRLIFVIVSHFSLFFS